MEYKISYIGIKDMVMAKTKHNDGVENDNAYNGKISNNYVESQLIRTQIRQKRYTLDHRLTQTVDNIGSQIMKKKFKDQAYIWSLSTKLERRE